MRISRYYFLIVILSLLPFIFFFSSSLLPHTHDGLMHLARIAAFFKSLKDWQIPVRWAGDLNYGYGMPLFNFMYPLPYFIASLFVSSGLGLVLAFKLTLFLSFILSGIFTFGFTKLLFGDLKKAFVVTIFYQFAPFRLVEVLIRGSFGEVYVYAFLPLVLWGLLLLFKKTDFRYVALTSIATALLILSHNAISLVFFLIAFGFLFVFGKKTKNCLLGLLSLLLGLLLSSFYWIPAILEHKYTYGNLFMEKVYLDHFPPIQNLFMPNLFNSVGLQTGGVSTQIGILQVIVFFVAIFILITHKKIESHIKRLLVFCLVISLLALLLMQPISKSVWETISFLRQFQFPWRLLSVFVFTTSLLSVSLFCFNLLNRKWIFYLLIFLVIFPTAYYWKPQLGLDRINENDYWNYPLTTTYYGETDLIWSKGPASSYPKQRIEVIGGQGKITNFSKKSNFQSFDVNAKTNVQLVAHIQYFPGWKVYVDDHLIPIEFQDQNWRGQITFYVPKGARHVRVVFSENKLRFAADMLTVSSLGFLLLFDLFRKRFKFI